MNYSQFKKFGYLKDIEIALEKCVPKDIKDIIFNYYYNEEESSELILQKRDIKWKIAISDKNSLYFAKFSNKFQKWSSSEISLSIDADRTDHFASHTPLHNSYGNLNMYDTSLDLDLK